MVFAPTAPYPSTRYVLFLRPILPVLNCAQLGQIVTHLSDLSTVDHLVPRLPL